MNVYVYKNAQETAKAAAMVFAAALLKKPDAVIGLATGSTPIPLYKELVRLNQENLIDFSAARAWNLDEYVGLGPDHEAGYRRFMNEQLFDHINIDKNNTHVPNGIASDLDQEARDYDASIEAAGGIDVQLLGIGTNGHIGFNEPADKFVFGTHVVDISESTIADNARFFASIDDVPRQAISMGVGTIMLARTIVLVATGKSKAAVIAQTVKGDIDPMIPATILRCHPDVQIFLDTEAASEL